MKIQIINCLDLLYPYQVMRIVKKTADCEIVYDVKDRYVPSDADVIVVLVKDEVSDVETWLKSCGINEKKVIWFTERQLEGKCCWVMENAYEKEFDFEKLIQYLFCVVNQNPQIHLMESMKLSLSKVNKDACVSDCVDKALKRNKKKDHLMCFVFIKDKSKRKLEGEDHRISLQQFWIKGVGQEAEMILCKRKSWAN